jgi:hypothetical protein
VELQVNSPDEVTLKPPLPWPSKPPLVEIVTVHSARESGLASGEAGDCASRFRLVMRKIIAAMTPVLVLEFICTADLASVVLIIFDNVYTGDLIRRDPDKVCCGRGL